MQRVSSQDLPSLHSVNNTITHTDLFLFSNFVCEGQGLLLSKFNSHVPISNELTLSIITFSAIRLDHEYAILND